MRKRGVFIIGSSQLSTLLQGDAQAFSDSLTRYIIKTYPDAIRGIPPHLILSMVEAGIKRGKGHGLNTDEQLFGFVSVMFEISPNFDTEPTLASVLSDNRRTPAERWRTLFKDTPLLNAAWERAASPEFFDSDAWLDSSI